MTLLTASFAEASGGRLHLIGGGWTRLLRPNVPTPVALAIKLRGTTRLNEAVPWIIELCDERGKAFIPASQPNGEQKPQVRIEGSMESKPDIPGDVDPVDAAIAVNMAISLPEGRYEWHFSVGGDLCATWTFRVGPRSIDPKDEKQD